MTKRDIATLLSPSIFFILVAVAAFWTSDAIGRHTRDDGGQQKFDTFVKNVQSGKWQLTTDRWLEGMRQERAIAEAYREAGTSTADMMRDLVWASLVGIAFQVAVVFSVRKRLRKP